MKKKITLFGRQISVIALTLVAIAGLASAGLLSYYGMITGTATLQQSVRLSEDGITMKAEYIKIPRSLHYDYFEESTGELKGGQIERDEFDFFLRVPDFQKTKKLIFYKTYRDSRPYTMNKKILLERSDNSKLIGEIDIY